MLDDVSAKEIEKRKPTPEAVKVQKKKEPVKQVDYYDSSKEKQDGKGLKVLLVIGLILLLAVGSGSVYWFVLRDEGAPLAEGVESGDVVGSWQGVNAGNSVYFQFLPNEMVNVAVPPEGYWFRTQYRVVKADTNDYLELYHRGLAEWERIAEISFTGEDSLTMFDTWEGIVVNLERIPDPEFREVINELRFER